MTNGPIGANERKSITSSSNTSSSSPASFPLFGTEAKLSVVLSVDWSFIIACEMELGFKLACEPNGIKKTNQNSIA